MKGADAIRNSQNESSKNSTCCAALVTVRHESKRLPDKALSIIVDDIPSITIVVR